MPRTFTSLLCLTALATLAAVGPRLAQAHCEVPCGIYADQMRFEMMLEDHSTITKASLQIIELTGKSDATSANQLARWVATKEAHATKTQHVIAQYFMAQRIKPPAAGSDPSDRAAYVKKLTAAHAVMTAAMRCKQTVGPAARDGLRSAIETFYEAYEGKPFGG